jgi:hypothetical protein
MIEPLIHELDSVDGKLIIIRKDAEHTRKIVSSWRAGQSAPD